MARTTKTYPLGFRPCQASAHAFDDATALELCHRGKNVHLEFARRRRAVDALPKADERHAERLQFVEDEYEVLQVTTEAVEAPAHNSIAAPLACIREQRVQRRPPVFRAADTTVHERSRLPSASSCKASEFLQLIVRFLVEC
jgi:hypothetical protein